MQALHCVYISAASELVSNTVPILYEFQSIIAHVAVRKL